jgi:transcription elongation factor
MENPDELAKIETQLDDAVAGLQAAKAMEAEAEHEVEEALDELHDLENLKPHEILLKIATPKGLFVGIFRDSATVATVIATVVEKKDLSRKDTFELVHGETVLQPVNRTLESFDLKRKADLELVATGSGV